MHVPKTTPLAGSSAPTHNRGPHSLPPNPVRFSTLLAFLLTAQKAKILLRFQWKSAAPSKLRRPTLLGACCAIKRKTGHSCSSYSPSMRKEKKIEKLLFRRRLRFPTPRSKHPEHAKFRREPHSRGQNSFHHRRPIRFSTEIFTFLTSRVIQKNTWNCANYFTLSGGADGCESDPNVVVVVRCRNSNQPAEKSSKSRMNGGACVKNDDGPPLVRSIRKTPLLRVESRLCCRRTNATKRERKKRERKQCARALAA